MRQVSKSSEMEVCINLLVADSSRTELNSIFGEVYIVAYETYMVSTYTHYYSHQSVVPG